VTDGAATVEKAASGNANIVGMNVNVPVKALPAQAQLALQKNQRNFGATDSHFAEEDEEEDEEDFEDAEEEHSPTRAYQLGAFIKVLCSSREGREEAKSQRHSEE
jgi:hypothetical protein